jgi:very-short-patch-repair endonuclease
VRVAQLLERSKVPPFVPQYRVVVAGKRYRLDFAWPQQRVALECDGRRRHSEDGDFQHDRARWSDLASDGWRIVFVTWDDLQRRMAGVIARLTAALAA